MTNCDVLLTNIAKKLLSLSLVSHVCIYSDQFTKVLHTISIHFKHFTVFHHGVYILYIAFDSGRRLVT